MDVFFCFELYLLPGFIKYFFENALLSPIQIMQNHISPDRWNQTAEDSG
jgi:hypothetical protein